MFNVIMGKYGTQQKYSMLKNYINIFEDTHIWHND